MQMHQHTMLVVAVKEHAQRQRVLMVVALHVMVEDVLIHVLVCVEPGVQAQERYVLLLHVLVHVKIIHVETVAVVDLLLEDVEHVLLHIVLIIVLISLDVKLYVHLIYAKDWPPQLFFILHLTLL
jgi:hypothetical protein